MIFDENISFDHYFGTYPNAANTDGTHVHRSRARPKANTLVTSGTLTNNPNLYPPKRLTPAQARPATRTTATRAEQAGGGRRQDGHVRPEDRAPTPAPALFGSPGLVMDYYDGNTVTGLWNYAQNYSMSDNNWDTTFGPSTPGALNLISGQTHGGTAYDPKTGAVLPTSTAVSSPNAAGVGTVIGDPDPVYDDCSDNDHTSTSAVVGMAGKNVGDLLNGAASPGAGSRAASRRPPPGTARRQLRQVRRDHGEHRRATPKDYSPHH